MYDLKIKSVKDEIVIVTHIRNRDIIKSKISNFRFKKYLSFLYGKYKFHKAFMNEECCYI